MVCITTKYLGPTNFRGSRVSVRSGAGKVSRITVSWDHALGSEENHEAAAMEYARRNDWIPPHYGRLVGGSLPDDTGYAFVFVKDGPK